MRISEILSPAAVRSQAQVSSKKRLFHDLAEMAAQAYKLDPAATLDALQERESLGATGVGHGVALPHARIPGIRRPIAALLRHHLEELSTRRPYLDGGPDWLFPGATPHCHVSEASVALHLVPHKIHAREIQQARIDHLVQTCLLYTSPSPRD